MKASEYITPLRRSQAVVDEFHHAKFDDDGNVKAGWDFSEWVLERVADIPRTCNPVAAFQQQRERVHWRSVISRSALTCWFPADGVRVCGRGLCHAL